MERNTITPHLSLKNAPAAIDFYKKVFGAEEAYRLTMPDGKTVMHACLKFGDSHVMLADTFQGPGCPEVVVGTNVTIHLVVPDVDKTFKAAVDNGATVTMPVADMFWGDRYGRLVDQFGVNWSLATPKEHLSPEQMQERGNKFMQEMAGMKK